MFFQGREMILSILRNRQNNSVTHTDPMDKVIDSQKQGSIMLILQWERTWCQS